MWKEIVEGISEDEWEEMFIFLSREMRIEQKKQSR
jgi:hypothetical protein